MSTGSSRLQPLALALRSVPGADAFYRAWYGLGTRAFAHLALRAGAPEGAVSAVYLRRGGGRGELVPGASDLDFFLVLEALPAEREMEFLKRFWGKYHFWRRLFPFWGEVLMGERAELRQWLETPTVRSHEAHFGWRLLAGSEERGPAELAWEPDPRDVFSEALKEYWMQLQAVIKLRDEQFRADLSPASPAAVHLRNAAKATLDLFRLHYAASLPLAERPRAWRASRRELTSLLPRERYGNQLASLRNLLELRAPLFTGVDPFPLFASLTHTACGCLDELAASLATRREEEAAFRLVPEAAPRAVDDYSLSVRELFAERTLLRHVGRVSRALLSRESSHLYFLCRELPPAGAFAELLRDLRDVGFSFDRFSLAMPLTERAFAELERTPLLDSPFHSFATQRELRVTSAETVEAHDRAPPLAPLPRASLVKTFAELSFSLRFPPLSLEYFLERTVGLVLALRLASERGEVAHGFASALAAYSSRFPARARHLEASLLPYWGAEAPAEAEAWREMLARLERDAPASPRVALLRAQLEALRSRNLGLAGSPTRATDLWIQLTPFLRMEMSAMKERYVSHRSPLKV